MTATDPIAALIHEVFFGIGVTPSQVERVREFVRAREIASANEALERAANRGDAWRKSDHIRLAAGEMTAQEIRTAQAVAAGIVAAIRALKQDTKETQ